MGWSVERAMRIPWWQERLLLEGMEEEGLVELNHTAPMSLAEMGVTVRSVG